MNYYLVVVTTKAISANGDLSQTLNIIHEDKRWINLRTYLTDIIGDFGVTLIGGVIVSLVCPVMFIVSNVLLGIGLNFTSLMKGEFGSTLNHIISELKYQTVIISDTSRLERNGTNGFTWWKIPKLSLSFMVYLLPSVALLSVLSFGRSNMTLCHPMQAPFLFDNTFVPANNLDFEELYRQRHIYGWNKDNYYYYPNGQLVWNADWGGEFIHYEQYWNFSSLNDLIKQFNFVGYHDVCNYPTSFELHYVSWNSDKMKGFDVLYPGYNERDSSGPNYKK